MGSFHNSLTLLTAEINGRSFWGWRAGVTEQISQLPLAMPLAEVPDALFADLDRLARDRGADNDALVEATDRCVIEALRMDRDMWRLVAEARLVLRDRRLARN